MYEHKLKNLSKQMDPTHSSSTASLPRPKIFELSADVWLKITEWHPPTWVVSPALFPPKCGPHHTLYNICQTIRERLHEKSLPIYTAAYTQLEGIAWQRDKPIRLTLSLDEIEIKIFNNQAAILGALQGHISVANKTKQVVKEFFNIGTNVERSSDLAQRGQYLKEHPEVFTQIIQLIGKQGKLEQLILEGDAIISMPPELQQLKIKKLLIRNCPNLRTLQHKKSYWRRCKLLYVENCPYLSHIDVDARDIHVKGFNGDHLTVAGQVKRLYTKHLPHIKTITVNKALHIIFSRRLGELSPAYTHKNIDRFSIYSKVMQTLAFLIFGVIALELILLTLMYANILFPPILIFDLITGFVILSWVVNISVKVFVGNSNVEEAGYGPDKYFTLG